MLVIIKYQQAKVRISAVFPLQNAARFSCSTPDPIELHWILKEILFRKNLPHPRFVGGIFDKGM